MDPLALDLIGDLFWDHYQKLVPLQIAALEVTSLTLLGALLQKATARGIAASGVFIRKSRKKTGRQRLIEGELTGDPIVAIDDLTNSGRSFIKIALALEEAVRKVDYFFSLINFQSPDGRENFKTRGITPAAVFALSDFNLAIQPLQSSLRKFEIAFSVQTGARHLGQFVIPASSHVVQDGLVFFGTDEAALHALDSRTGKIRWTYQAEKRPKGIISSPAVSRGKVYFGAYDSHNTWLLNYWN